MSIVYRTTDALRWGAGQGANLSAAQVDGNFWSLYEQVQAATGTVTTSVVSIDYVTVQGNLMTVYLTDHSRQGPFTIPTAEFIWGGAWLPNTAYARGTLLTEGNALYFVLEGHTSGAHFDSGAVDSAHHPIYALVVQAPPGVIPPGGTTGQSLIKQSALDFDTGWATVVGVPQGGLTNQVLTKTSDADYAVNWLAIPYVPAGVTNTFLTTYNLSLGDANTYIRFNSASPAVVNIPLIASVAFQQSDEISFRQTQAAGVVTLTPVTGVTINGIPGYTLSTNGQGAVITIKCLGNNQWDAWGMFGT